MGKKSKIQEKFKNSPWIFTSLFFGCLILSAYLKSQSFTLEDAGNEILPGIASRFNIDINQRIKIYYQALILFTITLSLTWYILNKSFLKKYSNYTSIINQLSFFGVIAYALHILGYIELYGIKFILGLICFTALIILISISKKAPPFDKKNLTILFLYAISLSFLTKDICLWIAEKEPVSFTILFMLSGLFLLILYSLFFRFKKLHNKFLAAFKPIVFYPVITILSYELYMILKEREVNFNPDLISLFFLFLLIIFSFFIAYRFIYIQKIKLKNLDLSNIFYWLIAGVLLLTLYPLNIPQPTDMFELANPANSLMRIFCFKEWPFLDFLSSHLLSEQLFGIFYFLINGYNGSLNFMAYDFLYDFLALAFVALFLSTYFKDKWYVLFILFMLPFVNQIFNHHFAYVLPSLLLLDKALSSKKFINYTIFIFLYSYFLLFWRLDTGIANFVAVIPLSFIIAFNHPQKGNIKSILWINLSALFLLACLFFSLHFFTESNLLLNLKKAIYYFKGNQAHGYPDIKQQTDLRYFFFYFFVPVSILASFIYISINSFITKELKTDKYILLFLFLSIVYFVNFQRGLVRHSLYENSTSFVISTGYILIAFAVIILTRGNKERKFVITSLLLFLLVNTNNQPMENYFDVFCKKFKTNFFEQERARVNYNYSFAKGNYIDFTTFMNNHFEPKETFIDFSNSPMLYYYSQRNVPSYFNQYMQNTIDNKLQKMNLEHIKNFDIPVVVFAHTPLNWWDNTDDFPNTVRYYTVCNYIYKHYKPYKIINNYQVWVRKELKNYTPHTSCLNEARQTLNYELGYWPYHLNQNMKNDSLLSIEKYTYKKGKTFLYNRTDTTGVFLKISFNKNPLPPFKGTVDYKTNLGKEGSFQFIVPQKQDKFSVLIPVSSQYNWYNSKTKKFSVNFDEQAEIKNIEIIQKGNENKITNKD